MAHFPAHFLERLPAKDCVPLVLLCKPVRITLGEVLFEAGQPAKHVYFPIDSFVSMVARVDGRQRQEVGMIGCEGMLGSHLALDMPKAGQQSLVQGTGTALRMGVARLRRELQDRPAFRRQVNRYLYLTNLQLANSVACVSHHAIDARLARWLLMSHDRAHLNEFAVTHGFMAIMLGVRRAGVSQAAGELQRRNLIHYRRGVVSVIDRHGLERASCSCYSADCRIYDQVLAAPARPQGHGSESKRRRRSPQDRPE